jgi:hypothetical protein
LEELLADIEGRRYQPASNTRTDIIAYSQYLAETGQEDDSPELINAREMALATTGLFADCTPTMAYNYHFGDKEAFYSERFARVAARGSLPDSEVISGHRPKRATAERAPASWIELTPRKRQRRE